MPRVRFFSMAQKDKERNKDMADTENTSEVTTNTYQFRLTILKNDVIDLTINSSSVASKWFNIVAMSIVGFSVIIGLFGKNFIEIYHMLVK